MKRIKVGILGAAGFSGLELVKILAAHKNAELVFLTSERFAGRKIVEFLPELLNYSSGSTDMTMAEMEFENLNPHKQAGLADVVFFALPAEVSIQNAEVFLKDSVVIDLSAGFRIKDKSVYEAYYKHEHTQTGILEDAVYGLTELYRDSVKNAKIIANPGCYPTSALLPLLPLIQSEFIDPGLIIIDSKSAVSGMGRKVNSDATFMEIYENFRAYAVGTHRHTPEISQEISLIKNGVFKTIFTPHLVPMKRGILSTIYFNSSKKAEDCIELLAKKYEGEPFIRVTQKELPQTGKVEGTNLCWMTVVPSGQPGTLIAISAIDNLIKGAAGQAVQNFNVRFGFDEREALI